jgi:DNA-directed RNA polymerase subunit M/transcription elongation factor TFIIS
MPERAKKHITCPQCGSSQVAAVRKREIEQARKAKEQAEQGQEENKHVETEPGNIHGCLLAFVVFFTFGLALLIPIILSFAINTYQRIRYLIVKDREDPVLLYICQDCRHRWRAQQPATQPQQLQASSERGQSQPEGEPGEPSAAQPQQPQQ